MENKKYLLLLAFLVCALLNVNAQEVLFSEDFNDCSLPSGWTMNVTNDQNGLLFGYPQNTNSDSLSVDGTCMVMFDDDLLGNNMPTFVGTLTSPFFSTKDYQTVRVNADVHFRSYSTSSFSVYALLPSNERILLTRFSEDDGTGSQFSETIDYSVDLRLYTDSEEIALVFEYDDDDMYAWWAGLDNVEVIGSGAGEVIISELFDDCTIPAGWESNILEGEAGWMFGEVDNNNASANTMNGSCFAFFDDDGLGQDAPNSTAELISPVFDGSLYANFTLEFDLIFRRYADFENISVYLFDGESYRVVREFSEAVAGDQFNQYEFISLDLTEYRSPSMQVVFRYDDGNAWGWWTGIDNVKIIGNGTINDLCTTADTLDIGKACIVSNNKNAIFSGPPNSCDDSMVGSLWYKLFAPASGIIKIENDANYNDQISVFSGNCDNLNEMSCVNRDEHGFEGEEVYLQVEGGELYWVRISGVQATYGRQQGRNCIAADYIIEIPQSNEEDAIINAISLTVNQSCNESNNQYANIENSQLPITNELSRADVWYQVELESGKNYNIENTTEIADIISVFDMDMNAVATSEHGGKLLLENVTQGMHYIQISGVFASIEGEVCVNVIEVEIESPAGDDCFAAEALSFDTPVEFSSIHQGFSGVQPSCNIYSTNDKWYLFSSGTQSQIYVTMESEYVNGVAIYTGSCDDLEEYWCDTDLNYCDGYYTIAVEPNTSYYMQVFTNYTMNGVDYGATNFEINTEAPEREVLSLNVTQKCNEDGTANLNIVVAGGMDVTLDGNASSDVLVDGETYIVVATSSDGCEASVSGIINCQASFCNLDAFVTSTYPTCANEANGSIILEIENGLGPYTYEWEHDSENNPSTYGLESGQYNVTVTDSRGCYITEEIIISEPEALLVNVNTTDESQAGSMDGAASLEVEGGVFPYTFLWSTGENSSSVENLVPDNYSVTITDYNGCELVKAFTINAVDCNFLVDANIKPTNCNGSADGTIELLIDEEITSISWSNGEEGGYLDGLEAGIYTVEVLLSNGCERIIEYEIEEPQPIIVSDEITNISCHGEFDGSVSLSAEGGSGSYQYVWTDGYEGEERNDIGPGIYTVSISDVNNCTEEHTLEITEPEPLDLASTMASNVSCHDSEDGVICAFVGGGTAPYMFDWEGIEEDMSKVMDLPSGSYPLHVTDINGCVIDTLLTIAAPDPISMNIDEMSISGTDDGRISVTIDGGVAPYNTVWFKNGVVYAEIEDLEDLEEGIYYAEITDANGCIFTSAEIVLSITAVVELPDATLTIFPNPNNGQFVVKYDGNLSPDATISLSSITGQRINKSIVFDMINSHELSVKINDIPSGVYLINIVSESNKMVAPIVIHR